MWAPRTADELAAAVLRGDLEETHTFDAKLKLGKNRDLAIDVCAMTLDGGSLLYGLGEDKETKRLTVLQPFELSEVPERISQIVETSILEVPTIRVRSLPLASDERLGFIVVEVPPSPRAPHQVSAGGDLRFYGRGAKGNRILNEREIADVYARPVE
jgi:predicted HTH transcriptional regulator